MERALSWPIIKMEDVRAVQEYSLFLHECSNAMEDVHLRDLDTPTNMLDIIKKLPYKLRDLWRSHVCDLQEKHHKRAKFKDIANFVGKEVKILTDPVFGNIQDTASTKPHKFKSHLRSNIQGTSFATTVNQAEGTTKPRYEAKPTNLPVKRKCPCCSGEHRWDACAWLEKMAHKEIIDYLKKNGFCFRCLCIGHISRNCTVNGKFPVQSVAKSIQLCFIKTMWSVQKRMREASRWQ